MKDFDWVTARNACSLADIFESLKHGVSLDCERRNAAKHPVKFSLKLNGVYFTVARDGEKLPTMIKFTLTGDSITVAKNDKVFLSAIPKLDCNGECKLNVSGQELNEWQFRMMALEDLFFGK